MTHAASPPRASRRYNSIKQNGWHEGSWKIFIAGTTDYDADPLASGSFDFLPHWRPTGVSVSLDRLDDGFSGMLVVTNEWDEHAVKHVTCN